MTKKFVILTGVGIAAVAAGAYVARKRRAGVTVADLTESRPIATVVQSAKRFANDWRDAGDRRLDEELTDVIDDEVVTAR